MSQPQTRGGRTVMNSFWRGLVNLFNQRNIITKIFSSLKCSLLYGFAFICSSIELSERPGGFPPQYSNFIGLADLYAYSSLIIFKVCSPVLLWNQTRWLRRREPWAPGAGRISNRHMDFCGLDPVPERRLQHKLLIHFRF
jgi:hypothetical protein